MDTLKQEERMTQITELKIESWHEEVDEATQQFATNSLEEGKVLFIPNLSFTLNEIEDEFLSPDVADPNSKNISYDIDTKKIRGASCEEGKLPLLEAMMHRYAVFSQELVYHLFPHYIKNIKQARTSYRPVEVKGRPSSYRKDDTRLHVDAFPSTPTGGQRIIRVFTNVNPEEQSRYWRLGAPFEEVASKFISDIRKPLPGEAKILRSLKITRGLRTHYDHYMSHIHNKMKKDMVYQKNVDQEAFYFPPGSTWIVYTDQVSHAAMTGQYLFEQSFYLPVHGMLNPEQSPLKTLEKQLGYELV